MAGKFKKSTSYFDVAAEKAEERQQKIVESASEPQKPAQQVRKAGRPKRALKGHLRGLFSCLCTFRRVTENV